MADSSRLSLLREIRNPLIFFALALVVTEGAIIGMARIGLPEEHRIYAVYAMVAVLMLVVGLVAIITLWRPSNLYNTVTELKESINSTGFRDAIEDVIMEQVKPECLATKEEIADSG